MKELKRFNWQSFKNETLKRGFMRAITLLGDSSITDPNTLFKWKQLKAEMNRIFSTSKVVLSNNQTLNLESNITSIFQKRRDYDYLKDIWHSWRDSSGKRLKHLYPDYVNLSNLATKGYGFRDYGEYSRSNFEANDFVKQLDDIYAKLEHLYRLLHAYVKKKLAEVYPDKMSTNIGPMPAHVLGDLWAQQWHNIFELVKPFKNKPLLDVTDNMIRKVTCSYLVSFIG